MCTYAILPGYLNAPNCQIWNNLTAWMELLFFTFQQETSALHFERCKSEEIAYSKKLIL